MNEYYESHHRYDFDPENREKKRLLDYVRKTVGIENVMVGDQIVNEPLFRNRKVFGKTRFILLRDGIIIRTTHNRMHRIGRVLKNYKLYTGRPKKTDAEKKKSKHDYNVWYYQFHTKRVIG
jgi:hypothetical protein